MLSYDEEQRKKVRALETLKSSFNEKAAVWKKNKADNTLNNTHLKLRIIKETAVLVSSIIKLSLSKKSVGIEDKIVTSLIMPEVQGIKTIIQEQAFYCETLKDKSEATLGDAKKQLEIAVSDLKKLNGTEIATINNTNTTAKYDLKFTGI